MKVIEAAQLVPHYGCTYDLVLGSAGSLTIVHPASGRSVVLGLDEFLKMSVEAFMTVLSQLNA